MYITVMNGGIFALYNDYISFRTFIVLHTRTRKVGYLLVASFPCQHSVIRIRSARAAVGIFSLAFAVRSAARGEYYV